MKSILIACLLLIAMPAFAEEVNRNPNSIDQVKPANNPIEKTLLFSGEVSILSDDIFRGISFSNRQPVVQGWLGLSYSDIGNIGIFTTSTAFPVPGTQTLTNTTGDVARRYNMYFAEVKKTINQDFQIGFKYYYYDFLEYSFVNQSEYILDFAYKTTKLSYIFNNDYLQLGTTYQYISLDHTFLLTQQDSINVLISTTMIEKPELVNVRNYEEFRLTYTKDLDYLKVNTIFSTTNREKYYTDEKYKDTAIAFGVTVPF